MPSCTNCKKRKLKCDGERPACGRCASTKRTLSTPCDYNVPGSSDSPAKWLPRGDACLPCRKKKKKCNGEHPVCRTCIVAKKPDGCIFTNDSDTTATTAPSTNEGRSRMLSDLERLLGGISAPGNTLGLSRSQHLSSVVNTRTGPNFSEPSVFSSMLLRQSTMSDEPPGSGFMCTSSEQSTFYGGQTALQNRIELSSTSLIQGPNLMSFLDPETNYMELRTAFIQNGILMGQSVTYDKWRALVMGDTSWNVVHPAFVHLAQVYGAKILNRKRRSQALAIAEEQHRDLAVMLLSSSRMTTESVLAHIQCYCLLSVHYSQRRDIATSRDWLMKADGLVRQFDLHIQAPPEGVRSRTPPGFEIGDDYPYSVLVADNESDEMRDALCQLLYIDSVNALKLRLPSLVNPRLRQEFDALLLHCLSHMDRASIVVLRMASVALLQEARLLTEFATPHPFAAPIPPQFDAVILKINLFLADVNQLLKAVPNTKGDRPWYLMLRQCTLAPTTALVAIYHHLSPSDPKIHERCLSAIRDIVHVSTALTPEDCAHVDPIVSVCWAVSLNILTQIQNKVGEDNAQNPHFDPRTDSQTRLVITFMSALRGCGSKVEWPYPLTGGWL